MCLIDYRGFRLVAMSLLPVSNDTLIYGTTTEKKRQKFSFLFLSFLSFSLFILSLSSHGRCLILFFSSSLYSVLPIFFFVSFSFYANHLKTQTELKILRARFLRSSFFFNFISSSDKLILPFVPFCFVERGKLILFFQREFECWNSSEKWRSSF